LEELKRQQELQNQLAVQRTIQLRDRKIKFIGMYCFVPTRWQCPIATCPYLPFCLCWCLNCKERRKIERMIRRLEKQQRSSADDVGNKLSKLHEDLEYVRVSPLQYTPMMMQGLIQLLLLYESIFKLCIFYLNLLESSAKCNVSLLLCSSFQRMRNMYHCLLEGITQVLLRRGISGVNISKRTSWLLQRTGKI
jgi:hypothetical protein